MERKLTAILCADVFGYSRLMGGDEEATLVTLTALGFAAGVRRNFDRFMKALVRMPKDKIDKGWGRFPLAPRYYSVRSDGCIWLM